MRPAAYEGARHARDAARRDRAVPRQRVELPRRPRRAAHLHLAHLQDVRRGLRRAARLDARSTAAACCASSPSTPASPFETIADYEVVYNVYDWGLNDAARDAAPRPDPLPRAGRALRRGRHRAARAAPLRGQLLQPHLRVVHDQRLARRLVPALRAGGARPGARHARRRRQHQVLRRRADAARRRRSSTRCATCARAASAACSRSSRTA